MRAILVGLAFVLLAAPLAVGQGHEHSMAKAMVVIAHDTPADGRTVVGDVTHFAAILFGADGTPQFHHNMEIKVALNGLPLFATTGGSGHDYDGINGFDLVFPVPGTYDITVTTEGNDGPIVGNFSGYVVPATNLVAATLKIDAPDKASPYAPVDFKYSIVDPAGVLIPHTDAIFEVRRVADHALVFRTHTHTHNAEQALRYAFSQPGDYVVSIHGYTAFTSAKSQDFIAFTATKAITVEGAPAAPPGPPTLTIPPCSPPSAEDPLSCPQMNYVARGEGPEPYVVLTTYDPYTVVGPFGQARLSTLIVDPTTMQAVQHVNFKALLTDMFGREIFSSESLHEYDGILEVLAGGQEIGQYHLAVEASRGNWTGKAGFDYLVMPPATALTAGPEFVEVQGFDKAAAGEPLQGVIFVHDLAGMPFQHGEVDLQVIPLGEGLAPLLATKLHTHGDGLFPFNVTLPAEGDYILHMTPFALEARPNPIFFGAGPGDPVDFAFKVVAGKALPVGTGMPLTPASVGPAAKTPGLEVGLVALGIAGMALATRRRA